MDCSLTHALKTEHIYTFTLVGLISSTDKKVTNSGNSLGVAICSYEFIHVYSKSAEKLKHDFTKCKIIKNI
jgi:hypothetical protein